jgi:hypothetical protein
MPSSVVAPGEMFIAGSWNTRIVSGGTGPPSVEVCSSPTNTSTLAVSSTEGLVTTTANC